ncbi:hypothetical protein D6D17_10015 [Aureobasidium pullulans]|nr:hypothetical protein D6D17_10015 [Aureobasidium pullulans]
MKLSRYSIILARGFLLLLLTLLLPTSEASYHIQVVDIGAAACNSDVIAGALLGIRWSIDNSSAADGDQCGLAIRSMLNTVDDDAYVIYKHVPCSFTSYNLFVPLIPYNTSLFYNGSSYAVQLISPAPNNVVQWSCPFQIHPEGWQPPLSTSERLAEQANNISQLATHMAYQTNSTTRSIGIAGIVCGVVGALVGALIAAGFSYYVERRREKKHGQAVEPLLPFAQGTAPNTAPGTAQPAEMPNTPEVGTAVRPASPV